jgi:tRNA-dihydrouridine synthase A
MTILHKHLLSIAPMIDKTNRHFRYFMRILAPNALLYTEMITVPAILHNANRVLEFSAAEQPVALQLGGDAKDSLSLAAKIAESYGYKEINLNLGCPSSKVRAGNFGACLMLQKDKVRDCIKALKDAVSLPISAKIRIGIDHNDSYAFFADFVHTLVASGCDKIIIHARKAWLNGLSPKQNRSVPKINYEYVYQIKKELPKQYIVINGDIKTLNEIQSHLAIVDEVMLGRLAYENPFAIAELHQALYPEHNLISRSDAQEKYLSYTKEHAHNVPKSILLAPLMGLYYATANAKQWRCNLTKSCTPQS